MVGFIFLYPFSNTKKIAALWVAFFIACGGLHPLAASLPIDGALQAQPKMLEINLEIFTEIYL